MYMRSYPKESRRSEIPIPATYGGTAMERRPSADEQRAVGEGAKDTRERNGESVRSEPKNEQKSAVPVKASPAAAGVLLPRYDSEEGAGLERLAAEDDGYALRARENAAAERRPRLLPKRENGEANRSADAAIFKKPFGEEPFSESTLVALLLLILGMGEENGTPLLLLGLLLLLS